MDALTTSGNDLLNQYVIPWAINIALALAVFIIGRWVAKAITNTIKRVMTKYQVDGTLVGFTGNIVYTVLLVVVVIAALDRLGVDTTSVLAVFAAAGLAVGLALKDSLSNFSAGVMLILFKPFKVGDFVEAGGTSGIVEDIGIFNTLMRTPDNREVTVPNSHIYGGIITNVTARDTRRIDLVVGIGYDDNIKKAKQLVMELMQADERILEDPAPSVVVLELGESSVDLAIRPWSKTSDFWAVRCELIENIKATFDKNGISIPFPQRDLHVHQLPQSGTSQKAAA